MTKLPESRRKFRSGFHTILHRSCRRVTIIEKSHPLYLNRREPSANHDDKLIDPADKTMSGAWGRRNPQHRSADALQMQAEVTCITFRCIWQPFLSLLIIRRSALPGSKKPRGCRQSSYSQSKMPGRSGDRRHQSRAARRVSSGRKVDCRYACSFPPGQAVHELGASQWPMTFSAGMS